MARIDIIKSVARNLGDLIVDGVPASYTGSTVDHLDLIHPMAEQLRGRFFYSYSGAGPGQSRVVASFNPTSRRLAFLNGFTTTPSTNTNFILTDQFAKADYDNALDRAIGMAKQKYLQDMVATMAIVGSQYEYPVPSGMRYIGNLQLVPTTGTDFTDSEAIENVKELPPRYWQVQKNVGGSYVIAFDSRSIILSNFDHVVVKVVGQAQPDVAATDNAAVPDDLAEYLTAHAGMQLAAQKQAAGEPWRTLFALFRDEVKPRTGSGLEDYIFRYGKGRKVG